MGLHAWRLSFRHPLSGERVSFEAKVPEWAGWPAWAATLDCGSLLPLSDRQPAGESVE
jgi:hypothetical protein